MIWIPQILRGWIVLALAGALSGGHWVDADQPLRSPALSIPLEPERSVAQTIVARHAGLAGVEVWLEPERGTVGTVTLSVQDPASAQILRQARIILSGGDPSGAYSFRFPDLTDSFNRRYRVVLTFEGQGRVWLGVGPAEAYLDGALYQGDQPQEAQLAFRLIYTPFWIAADLVRAAGKGLALLILAAFLYGGPGRALLWLWGEPKEWSGWAAWGLATGVSLAFYPLLFLWADAFGLRLGPLPIALVVVISAWLGWGISPRRWVTALRGALFSPPEAAALGVVGLAFGIRLLAVRGLEAPMWGDGFQHTVITQLLLDHGGLFTRWAPYAPISSFTYHFGFHSAAAALAWLTGWSASQAVLWGGQILNALATLSLYPLAVRLADGSRWAGAVAVLLPALLWPMPMFYVNWGRYPQLAGQAILPIAVLLTWDLLERPAVRKREILLVAGVIAGLALTHYRVLAFYLAFGAAWLMVRLWTLPPSMRGFALARGAAAGGMALLLLAPWLFRIGQGGLPAFLAQALQGGGSPPLPGREAWTFYLPVWGWVLAVGALIGGAIRRPCLWALLLAWWGIAFLGSCPQLLGLPGGWVISAFAFGISLYLPAALLIGSALGMWMEGRWQGRRGWILVGGIMALGLGGAWARLREVQPQTYALLTRSDREAMEWIQAYLPEGTRFLINGFLAYEGQDAVGSDGGWWLPLLARRAALIPPLPYAIERTEDPTLPVRLRAWIGALAARDLQVVRELIQHGWCYVYLGQRRGRVNAPGPELWDPEFWEAKGVLREIYRHDRVRIFRLSGCEGGLAQKKYGQADETSAK